MLKLILVIFNLMCINESARILGIFPYPGYSQYKLGSTLMKELAAKGHEVTVISPFSQQIPIKNYKEIVTENGNIFSKNNTLYNLGYLNVFEFMVVLYSELGLSITEQTLKNNEVQKLLHSNVTFDLVINELFLNEAHVGFADHFHAPLVLFCSLGAVEWTNHLMGNLAPFSFVPLLNAGYTDRMSFWERLRNTAIGLVDIFYKHLIIFPKQNKLLKKYFPNSPELSDLIYNASLILLNSNIATNFPMAHLPNMIEIGGFHVSSNKLPKDLQEFLDNAENGVVLFSMGSNLNTSDLGEEKLNAVLRVFSKLKQKVLWKWENGELPEDNIKVVKWMPQQDILAHPNIRAFVTHGGLLSVTEAIYNGVPMVGIPVYADQPMNIKLAALNGLAIEVPFLEFTEEKFAWALNEILTNSSYKDAAKKRSEILRDKPVQPLDNAVFWVEYVLRHPGAKHLRTAALDLYWYQYFLIDIIVFVVIVVIVAFLLCTILICKIIRCDKTKRISKDKIQ